MLTRRNAARYGPKVQLCGKSNPNGVRLLKLAISWRGKEFYGIRGFSTAHLSVDPARNLQKPQETKTFVLTC